MCSGAAQILEVMEWILRSGLRPCRVKNKFAMAGTELTGGYRDLMVCVLFKDPNRQALLEQTLAPFASTAISVYYSECFYRQAPHVS